MESSSRSTSLDTPSLEDIAPFFPAYEMEGILAENATGPVYQALQKSLDRRVAIKIFPLGSGGDPAAREAFELTAKTLARIEHPHLVRILDFGEIDGRLFIVMEFVEGQSLGHTTNGQAVDAVEAAQLVIALARGLDDAHQHGLVHGSLNAGAILLDPDVHPRLIHFGFHHLQSASDRETEAPATLNRQTDIHDLGALFHELLTGRPFEPAQSPSDRSGESPSPFDDIISRATSDDPHRRYESAAAFADALEAATEALVSDAAELSRERPVSPSPNPVTLPVPKIIPPVSRDAETILPLSHLPPPAPKRKVTFTVPPMLVPLLLLIGIAIAAYQFRDRLWEVLGSSEETDRPALALERNPGERIDEDPGLKPSTETEKPWQSPIASLAEFKDALAAGKRDPMPAGARERGGNWFVLVDTPMTWHDAAAFAEEHGAHLAVFPSGEDRQWFTQKFADASKQPVWVGGAQTVGSWQWIDGTAWSPDDAVRGPARDESFVILSLASADGPLSSAPSSDAYPFALQWHADGENPGSVEAQLARTAQAVTSGGLDEAPYPLGTQSYEASRFYYLPRALSWDEARELAKSYGGHLAAPSSPEESAWMQGAFVDRLQEGLAWIGGYQLKPGDPWKWLTGEAWNHSQWLENEPQATAGRNRLALRGKPFGWVSSTGIADEVHGLLIEWSAPEPAPATPDFDLDSYLASVNGKIGERVQPDMASFAAARKKMITDYSRAMKRLERSGDYAQFGRFGGRRNEAVKELVDAHLDEVVKTGDLVDNFPEFTPRAFRDLHAEWKERFDQQQREHDDKFDAHLAFYRDGLTKKADDLFTTGYTDAAARLREILAGIEDTPGFLKTLDLQAAYSE